MAKAQPAIVVIVILVLLQVSWATARHYGGKHKHCGGTPAVMTLMKLEGEHGGCACDGRYYGDHQLVVALPSRWYAGGKRCHKNIRITSENTGRTVVAKVIDEYHSHHGACNDCKKNDNVVASSPAVWKKLGLSCTHAGKKVHVTWSDA